MEFKTEFRNAQQTLSKIKALPAIAILVIALTFAVFFYGGLITLTKKIFEDPNNRTIKLSRTEHIFVSGAIYGYWAIVFIEILYFALMIMNKK